MNLSSDSPSEKEVTLTAVVCVVDKIV